MSPLAKLRPILGSNIQGVFAWPALLGLAFIATLPGILDVRGAFSGHPSGTSVQVFISDKQFCAARCEEQEQTEGCVASCQAALAAIAVAPSTDSMKEDGDGDGRGGKEDSEACMKECEPLKLKCVADARQKCGPGQKCLGGEAEAMLKCEVATRPCLDACQEEEEKDGSGTRLDL